MAKPSIVPTWATGGTKTNPGGAKQATGWVFEEAPPFNYFNWWQGLVGDWTTWLDGRIDDDDVTFAFKATTTGQTFSFEPDGSSSDIRTDIRQTAISNTAGAAGAPVFRLRRAQRTGAAEAAVANNDFLGSYEILGWDGSAYDLAARVLFQVDGAVNAGSVPSEIRFQTTEAGIGSVADRLTIRADGMVGIGEVDPTARLEIADTTGDILKTSAVSGGAAVNHLILEDGTDSTSSVLRQVFRVDGDDVARIFARKTTTAGRLGIGIATDLVGTITETMSFTEEEIRAGILTNKTRVDSKRYVRTSDSSAIGVSTSLGLYTEYSIPANVLAVGDIVRVRVAVRTQNLSSPTGLRLGIGVYSGAFTELPLISPTVFTPTTTDRGIIDYDFVVRTTGASGTAAGGGMVGLDDDSFSGGSSGLGSEFDVDTTAVVNIRVLHELASGSLDLIIEHATVEII